MKKTIPLALGFALFGSLAVSAHAGAITITFDDPAVTPGSTLYEYDWSGDGIADIRFTHFAGFGFTPNGPGANQIFIQEPGLESSVTPRGQFPADPPEVIVEFLSPAYARAGFGFAVSNGLEASIPDVVTFEIYNAANVLIASATASSVKGTSSFNEGEIFASFAQPAKWAYINFRDDAQFGSFIIDNFTLLPEPASWGMMIMGFGLVGFAARRSRLSARIAAH